MEAALSETCFVEFLQLIHALTGITIAKNRSSMVEGRIRKRLKALQLPSYEDYLRLVRSDKAEQVAFVDLITTNETYFFRTPRIWDYVENKVLADWVAKRPGRAFMAWSAAASSGEEAYSLGALCQDVKEKNPGFLYQILATDISQEMIDRGRDGRYSGRSIEAFKTSRAGLFERQMRKNADGTHSAAPEIRARTRFQRHNLFNSLASPDRFDLILLRNVLIYFAGPDQESVLTLLAPRLSDDGTLIIGESESLSHIDVPYRPVEPLVYQLSAPSQLKVG